ncbi:MAG: DUF3251 domain-containing protein [Candidatus Omnitrophica bacterium]|nr:DUF3251 domain-containing protein [Candidatus Omnitrophota bacterium]
MRQYSFIFVGFLMVSLFSCPSVEAQEYLEQKVNDIENRLAVLENYIRGLPDSFNEFSQELLETVDQKIEASKGYVVTLHPFSKRFTKIQTNSGMFLISIQKVEKIEGGYKVFLHVGNPNAAAYSGIKLKMRWGKKWDESLMNVPYQTWRDSLARADYMYSGSVEPGQWTEIPIDMTPAQANQWEYIECEIEVSSLKLLRPENI